MRTTSALGVTLTAIVAAACGGRTTEAIVQADVPATEGDEPQTSSKRELPRPGTLVDQDSCGATYVAHAWWTTPNERLLCSDALIEAIPVAGVHASRDHLLTGSVCSVLCERDDVSACVVSPYLETALDSLKKGKICVATDSGGTEVMCIETWSAHGCYATGRRPEGLAPCPSFGRDALAEHFAHAAHLEAASVEAFERLRAELAHHGAPDELLEACDEAREDEIRHAWLVGGLALRFGATLSPPRATPPGVRSLVEIAIENVVEGVVREMYGAAEAIHRSVHARDEETRATMRALAEDECAHAELALRVDAWARSRLDEPDVMRVEEAERRAIAELSAALGRAPDDVLVEMTGLPTQDRAHALLDGLAREVWSRPIG